MSRSKSLRIGVNAVRALEAGEEIRDIDLKGFGVRRQQDHTSYFVHTRIKGRLRRLTIGRHGSPWTPETARKEASRLLLVIRSGGDPTVERDRDRLRPLTFAEASARFMELHAAKLKPRTQEGYESVLRVHVLPKLGSRPIADIGPHDLARAHAAWGQQPRSANLALAVVSSVLSWAEEQGLRPESSNPCRRIKRYREVRRERYLSIEELTRLGQVLDAGERDGTLNRSAVAAIRLLLVTGARRDEILTLRWDHVDLARRRLRLPDSKTGAKEIVLNSQAVAILEGLDRLVGNPWVLPGHVRGAHLVNLRKPWMRVARDADIADIRLHDLRHSFASIAVDAGGSLPVIGRLLGHRQAQTTARYAHVGASPADQLAEAAGARIAQAWTQPNVGDPSPPLPSDAAQKTTSDG